MSCGNNIVIDRNVGAPVHVKKIVDRLNATVKNFLTMLTTTLQLPGSGTTNSQMAMYKSSSNTDISLAKEYQKHILEPRRTHGLIDHRKDREQDIKRKLMDC